MRHALFCFTDTRLSVTLILMLTTRCSSTPGNTGVAPVPALTPCPEPRPQVCAREYLPVCARRESAEWKTYATGCTACSDARIIGYRPKACEQAE